jgi:hypothetical protein
MLRSAVFALVLAFGVFLGASPAGATSGPPVAISQAYGGGGNLGAVFTNDFVELHNMGAGTADLSGLALQYASAGGSSWSVLPLHGSIDPGGYFLVQLASSGAVGTALPQADLATTSINIGRNAGKLALARTTSAFTTFCPLAVSNIVDFVGYGTTATCYEGTGPAPAPSNDTGDVRAGSGCADTDDNAADLAAAAPVPRNSASAPHFCVPDEAPTVAGTAPVDGATEVSVGSNVTIRFSEPVRTLESWYEVACTSSGDHSAAALSADQTAFTLDPDDDFTPGESCTTTVFASNVSDVDANDPPDAMLADQVFGFTVGVGPPSQYLVSVSDLAPVAGETVTVRAQLADGLGNAVPQAERTVVWSTTGAGASLSAATSETDPARLATVELTTSSLAGTSHTVTGADAGDASMTGTSAELITVPGPADHLAFGPLPDTLASGTSAFVEVKVEDRNGNAVTSDFDRNVELTQTGGSGSLVWAGQTVSTTGGVARTSVTGRLAGPVSVTAASDGLAPCSWTFSVVPGAPTHLAFVNPPAALPFGAQATLSLEVRDVNQNTVVGDSGRAVSLVQSAGSGAVGGLGALLTSGGAVTTPVAGTASGTIAVSASATGLAGATTRFAVLAPDGTGTLSTPTVRVPNASSGNTIVFTYRAAQGGIADGEATIDVPAGWSAPSTADTSPGSVTSSLGSVGVSLRTIVVSHLDLAGGGRVQIVYGSTASGGPGATAPDGGGPQTWSGAAKASVSGNIQALAASPSINILAPDGSGTLSTRTASVKRGVSGVTVTFAYVGATGGTFDGAVKLVVPPGWSAPSTVATDPGFVSGRGGSISVVGREVLLTGVRSPGQEVSIVYGAKTAGGPGATTPVDAVGTQVWQASSKASWLGSLVSLAGSPAITVT